MIIYFSGTGNSRFVAKKLTESLEDEVVSVNDYLKSHKNGNFHSQKPYIFVTPTYMSRMPAIVEQFIKASSFSGNLDAYFVFTAGEAVGKAAKYCQKLCAVKGFNYFGTTSVAMPANYVVMYDVTPKSKAQDAAVKALPDIQKITEDIRQGRKLNENPNMGGHKMFSAIAPAFMTLMAKDKAFQVNDSCTGCGKCEVICSKNNVRLQGGKPAWQGDCMHCMACISVCPEKAIDYGKKTVKRERYYLEGSL